MSSTICHKSTNHGVSESSVRVMDVWSDIHGNFPLPTRCPGCKKPLEETIITLVSNPLDSFCSESCCIQIYNKWADKANFEKKDVSKPLDSKLYKKVQRINKWSDLFPGFRLPLNCILCKKPLGDKFVASRSQETHNYCSTVCCHRFVNLCLELLSGDSNERDENAPLDPKYNLFVVRRDELDENRGISDSTVQDISAATFQELDESKKDETFTLLRDILGLAAEKNLSLLEKYTTARLGSDIRVNILVNAPQDICGIAKISSEWSPGSTKRTYGNMKFPLFGEIMNDLPTYFEKAKLIGGPVLAGLVKAYEVKQEEDERKKADPERRKDFMFQVCSPFGEGDVKGVPMGNNDLSPFIKILEEFPYINSIRYGAFNLGDNVRLFRIDQAMDSKRDILDLPETAKIQAINAIESDGMFGEENWFIGLYSDKEALITIWESRRSPQ